jgi:tyrosyl-tRNA synthetase
MTPIFERALGSDRLPQFVDNLDWLGPITVLDFLRDVGKHFPVGEMIRRESVRRRLEEAEVGMSFTEFSYSLLQAYDFARLSADYGVTIQLGASDQWGNIVAGIDFIRKTQRTVAYGLTCPLLLRADGSKFGKSEQGAIWISSDRTSPYQLYQFLINLADDEARKFALFFSLSPRDVLEKLFADHAEVPARRALQRHIAEELTTLLHGADECERAVAASRALFTGDVRGLDSATLEQVFADVPSFDLERHRLAAGGLSCVDLLTDTGLATSRRQAREFLGGNAVSVNGDQVGLESSITAADLLHNAVLLVRRGKREWRVVRFN